MSMDAIWGECFVLPGTLTIWHLRREQEKIKTKEDSMLSQGKRTEDHEKLSTLQLDLFTLDF